jgi:hypothetical protein
MKTTILMFVTMKKGRRWWCVMIRLPSQPQAPNAAKLNKNQPQLWSTSSPGEPSIIGSST